MHEYNVENAGYAYSWNIYVKCHLSNPYYISLSIHSIVHSTPMIPKQIEVPHAEERSAADSDGGAYS